MPGTARHSEKNTAPDSAHRLSSRAVAVADKEADEAEAPHGVHPVAAVAAVAVAVAVAVADADRPVADGRPETSGTSGTFSCGVYFALQPLRKSLIYQK